MVVVGELGECVEVRDFRLVEVSETQHGGRYRRVGRSGGGDLGENVGIEGDPALVGAGGELVADRFEIPDRLGVGEWVFESDRVFEPRNEFRFLRSEPQGHLAGVVDVDEHPSALHVAENLGDSHLGLVDPVESGGLEPFPELVGESGGENGVERCVHPVFGQVDGDGLPRPFPFGHGGAEGALSAGCALHDVPL